MQSTNVKKRRPGGRRFFPRRKVCQFCVDKVTIDYKDVSRNRRFISEWGKIESRRKTGTCSPHQRQLSLAIKRGRYLALLPYGGGHSLMELSRPDPRGDRGRRPPFRPPMGQDGPPRQTSDALDVNPPATDAPAGEAPVAEAVAVAVPDAPAREAPVAEAVAVAVPDAPAPDTEATPEAEATPEDVPTVEAVAEAEAPTEESAPAEAPATEAEDATEDRAQ
jgi:small subunit ribosomal protein S18